MDKTVVLSTAYFAPIQYFCKLISYDKILIGPHEHFGKQSYRNRCQIYGANGALNLSIPTIKGGTHKTASKDIRIDYTENWQNIHFRSIGYKQYIRRKPILIKDQQIGLKERGGFSFNTKKEK